MGRFWGVYFHTQPKPPHDFSIKPFSKNIDSFPPLVMSESQSLRETESGIFSYPPVCPSSLHFSASKSGDCLYVVSSDFLIRQESAWAHVQIFLFLSTHMILQNNEHKSNPLCTPSTWILGLCRQPYTTWHKTWRLEPPSWSAL